MDMIFEEEPVPEAASEAEADEKDPWGRTHAEFMNSEAYNSWPRNNYVDCSLENAVRNCNTWNDGITRWDKGSNNYKFGSGPTAGSVYLNLPDKMTETSSGDSTSLPMPGRFCCICGKFARVPFARCNYCGDSPSYHHGRCCPWKPPGWCTGAPSCATAWLQETGSLKTPIGSLRKHFAATVKFSGGKTWNCRFTR
jgi:hypothetical protein